MMRLPEGWSEIEGAGYRVAAHTAYHSLVHRAGDEEGRRRAGAWRVGRRRPGGGAARQASRRAGDRDRRRRCAARGREEAWRRRRRRELPHHRLRRGGEGADRRQGRRRDLRSGRRRGAGEIDARGRLRRAAADRRLHLGRAEQDHVEPRADQGPDRSSACAPARPSPRIAPELGRDYVEVLPQARRAGRHAPAHLAPLPDGARGRCLPRADRPSGRRQGRDRDHAADSSAG